MYIATASRIKVSRMRQCGQSERANEINQDSTIGTGLVYLKKNAKLVDVKLNVMKESCTSHRV